MNIKAIDFHVHFGKPHQWKPWVTQWWKRMNPEDYPLIENLTRESFLSHLDKEGVEYAVILPERAPHITCDVTTEEVLEFCRGTKRLVPFSNININISSCPYRELEEHIDKGVKGLKVHPVHERFSPLDKRCYPLYYICEKRGIPVMFHTGSSIFPGASNRFGDPKLIDEIASDFPDLTIVMSHGGRGFWYKDAQFVVRIRKNVYIDVSGLPPHKLLDYFLELERLKDKFVFGTDWPGASMRKSIEAIMSLSISSSAKEAILRKNAEKILKLDNIS